MKLSRHYYTAQLQKHTWVPEENTIKITYVDFEKDFSEKELKKHLHFERLALLGYFIVGLLIGCLGFLGDWIFGLIFALSIGLVSLSAGLIIYFIYNYKCDYRYDLGEENGYFQDSKLIFIFAEELADLREDKLNQELLAEKWRKKHPLEEKIRLALTQNPNYIADLLRNCELVKPNKTTEQQRLKREKQQQELELANKAVKAKYVGDDT